MQEVINNDCVPLLWEVLVEQWQVLSSWDFCVSMLETVVMPEQLFGALTANSPTRTSTAGPNRRSNKQQKRCAGGAQC